MRQNSDSVTAHRTLTVQSVCTAAGTYFPSSLSYHSTKALNPQSAVWSGFMAATTDHTHIYSHRYRHTHSDTENLQISLCHWKHSSVSLFTVMDIWTHLPKHLQLSPSIVVLESIAVSA